MAARLQGCMAARLHGAWLQGCYFALQGCMAAWLQGC